MTTSGGNSQLVHEKDDQWTHTFYQLISDNQNGSANDHVLQLNSDGTVSCNGRLDDKNTHLKVYTGVHSADRTEMVCLLECKDRMICIENDKLYSKKKTKNYKSWDDAEDEIKFKRFLRSANSIYCGLQLFESSPAQYMGFNEKGEALKPSKVDLSKSDGFFLFRPVPKSD